MPHAGDKKSVLPLDLPRGLMEKRSGKDKFAPFEPYSRVIVAVPVK
jgi:hypothetical protein